MKTLSFLILLLGVTSIFLSCDQEEAEPNANTGKVNFVLNNSSIGNSGRINASSDSIHSILITVKNAEGIAVYNELKVNLIPFGEGYKIEPIGLSVGTYTLTSFIVLNSENEATYAIPNEESELDHLVADPLPITFDVTAEQTTEVQLEVVKIDEDNNEQFGYAILSFNIVNTFQFKTVVFVYDELTEDLVMESAELIISGNDQQILTRTLESNTNSITLKEEDITYSLTFSKDGFTSDVRLISLNDLKFYQSSPLVITLYPESLALGIEVYYPFSGSPHDQSGHGYQTTVHGAILASDRHNNINSAYYFDGTSHLDLGNILDDLQYPFTVSAWVKLQDNVNIYNPVFSSQDNLPLYNGFDVNINSTGIGVGYGDGLGENNSAFRRAKGVSASIYGEWTHICGVVNGPDDIKIYINGVEVAGDYQGSSTLPMDSNFPDDVARIGQRTSNGGTFNFKGYIDEVRVWSRALSDSEIVSSM